MRCGYVLVTLWPATLASTIIMRHTVVFLQWYPVLYSSTVVAEMQISSGLDSRENSLPAAAQCAMKTLGRPKQTYCCRCQPCTCTLAVWFVMSGTEPARVHAEAVVADSACRPQLPMENHRTNIPHLRGGF